jgi:hypothetical protein
MWAAIFNCLSNLCFSLAVRFGSKAWGGVDGAYRHGREMRFTEFLWWQRKDTAAVANQKFGDLDDCATAIIKGNQRYEVEEYNIEAQLRSAKRMLQKDVPDVAQAQRMLEQVVTILQDGKPKLP